MLGDSAMRSLAQSNVLICNLGGLGIEIGDHSVLFIWNCKNTIVVVQSVNKVSLLYMAQKQGKLSRYNVSQQYYFCMLIVRCVQKLPRCQLWIVVL